MGRAIVEKKYTIEVRIRKIGPSATTPVYVSHELVSPYVHSNSTMEERGSFLYVHELDTDVTVGYPASEVVMTIQRPE